MPEILNKIKKAVPFYKSKWFITIVVILVLIILRVVYVKHKGVPYQFIPVTNGSVTETVSVTGNTTPTQTVSLGFQNAGTISRVNYNVGDSVAAGAVIASLNTNDLEASYEQAQATVDAQQAKLDGLKAGARPEDITVAQVTLDNAKTDLQNTKEQQATLVTNAYSALLNSTLSAYQVTNSTNNVPAAYVPVVSGTYTSSSTTTGTYTLTIQSAGGQPYFSVTGLENTTGVVSTVAVPLGTHGLYIQFPNSSTSYYANTTWSIPIPNTQAINYNTNLNLYNSALTTQNTTVAQKQAAVAQAQAQLDLTSAASLPTDISAQEAQVEQAQAEVASAEAKLADSEIVAPISGVLTQQDAKVGQQGTPGTPLVSIIGNSGFEVDAGVSETDVGKLAVGDTVSMTLDAFPNETFTGSVFYIAPAETNVGGVISYQTKISFDKNDPRLKSGLTANIDIQTKHKDNVLILPQYAILQNDSGTYVETLSGKNVATSTVALGIQDQNGNVEMVSGVTLGEQVINIGLKTQ